MTLEQLTKRFFWERAMKPMSACHCWFFFDKLAGEVAPGDGVYQRCTYHEEMERDAKRYRWLREQHERQHIFICHRQIGVFTQMTGEYADGLIDEAMKTPPSQDSLSK